MRRVISRSHIGLSQSNPMEVEVGVDVTRGMLVLPAGLPGYEVYSAEGTTSNQAEDLGSSLLLTIPGLQLQLRTNDYYMGRAFILVFSLVL